MLLTMAACMAATLTFAIKSVVVIININNNKNENFFFIFFNCLVQIGPVSDVFVVEIFCFVACVEHYFYDGLGKLCLVCFVCGNFVGSREGA